MPQKVRELKKQLKENKIFPVYIFYGDEDYLIDTYLNQIKDMVVDSSFADFNYNIYEEKSASFSAFEEDINSFPQMSDKKMIVVKNADFLKLADYQDTMLKIIETIPDYCVTIFVEKDFGKVKKDIIKAVEKKGAVVEFTYQNSADLRAWVIRRLSKANKKMRNEDVTELIEICGCSLRKLETECDKLIASAGTKDVITRNEIDALVHVPLEFKIFKLFDTLLSKDYNQTYRMLQEFKVTKESPFAILSIIYSQLSNLLMFQQLGEKAVDLLPANKKFLARGYLRDCRKLPYDKLRKVMKMCAEFDTGAKSGAIEDWVALELIIGETLK